MEESLFSISEMGGIELYEVIDAYYECRRRKRRTVNAMKFELDWEQEALSLWHDINNGTYWPGRSIAFRGQETYTKGDIRSRLSGSRRTPSDSQENTAAA